MAWSAPPTFVVSEVVTAARMNILSDDLSYLKGLAGTVAIQDSMTVSVNVAAAAGMTVTNASANAGAYTGLSINNDSASSAGAYRCSSTNTAYGGVNSLNFLTLGAHPFGIGTSNQLRILVDANGNTGFGTSSPQGKLHGYDTIGGFLHWKYDGVDGTARTVIPDGTGDVLYYATGLFQVRTSGGAISATGSTIGLITPGTAQDLYNNAGNILSFAVAANGSVTVQRTGGALTYKVNLWLLWM